VGPALALLTPAITATRVHSGGAKAGA